MTQLQAGYILDCVKETLETEYEPTEVQGLLRQLSYFDIDVNSTVELKDNSNYEQILSVAHNIISRGLPTKPTLWLENKILQAFDLTERDEKLLDIGTIRQVLKVEETLIQKLFRALHIIDPNLKDNNISKQKINTWENLGSSFEEDFLYNQLPKYASPIWVQLLETQRELENVLRFSTTTEDEVEKYINGTIKIFNEQRLDFSIEFPYKIKEQRGFVVEIDGSQHENHPQNLIDTDRDNATEKAKWGKAIRIKTRDWKNIENKISPIKQFESEQFFNLLKQNFETPLYSENEGLTALQLSLIPFAVARIQKTILHLLFDGKLNINAEEWNFAIVEQDIPCGSLAIEDFKKLLHSLFKLKGSTEKLPKINVFVESDERFANANLHSSNNIDKSKKYDLLIDISILQRSGLTNINNTINADTKVLIRSAHSPKTDRNFKTTSLITFKPLGKKDTQKNIFIENKEQVEELERFVQTIFRKTGFRAGQVEIINRAIQGLSVIGLLPTGSGKSLTYQLTSLLQPGMTIIIDPIKSLMKDQFEGLLKNGIDGAVYINSSLNQKQRKIALEKIKKAQTIFAFVSPERLQDNTFRKELLETSKLKNHYFSYCVIDEAHCVSEWGHDFRTSYLRLGDNSRNYCIAKDREHLPFFALTATASYDVLSDIQRELCIPEETAIVRLEKLDRPEIQFKIIDITADIKPEKGLGWDNREALGKEKQDQLIQQLNKIPEYYKEFSNSETIIEEAKKHFKETEGKERDIRIRKFSPSTFYEKQGKENNAGLIFCPHKSWYFGVTDNAAYISQQFPIISVGRFIGIDGSLPKEIREELERQNELNQDLFIKSEIDLLVATKAFGMGIDKPNIRYVVHFNYPSSIESYYQEAGRGGRDRKLALGLILFNKQEVKAKYKIETVEIDGDIKDDIEEINVSIDKDILLSFHRNNFKGIRKEKNLLVELLTEIKFPSRKVIDTIEDRIIEEFNVEVNLKIKDIGGTKRIYIDNPEFGKPNVGSIYLNTLSTFVATPESMNMAQEILTFTKNILLSERPVDKTLFDWLNMLVYNHPKDGIETQLNDPNSKNSFQVIIPFTNDIVERIAKYLSDNGLEFTERIVKEAQNFCTDKEEFIENLEKQFNKFLKKKITIPDGLKQNLKNLFVQIRNEEDTYKAIYRLSVIGVVDDYTVDYNSKTITAIITKKPQGHYTQKLKEYLLQYNSDKKTNELIERVPYYRGNSEIQKCLGFLIKFVYEHIADLRKKSIDAMELACIEGLDINKGSKGFKEFIDLYMNSKYARPQFLPEDTQKGDIANFEIIKEYIDKVKNDPGGEINNLKHLRGATTKLLNESIKYSENYSLLILKAFSILAIEVREGKIESFINEAKDNFSKGFIQMFKEENLNAEEANRNFNELMNEFNTLDLRISEELEGLRSYLFLRLNTEWTTKFNIDKKIIEYA